MTTPARVLVSDFDGSRGDLANVLQTETLAFYLVSILQGENTERIAGLFDATGFWNVITDDPFSRAEWLTAVRLAPTIKEGFYTVLSSRDVLPEVERLLNEDPRLSRCFR